MHRDRIAAAWTAAQAGWPSSYPLVQFPNVPLLVSLLASLVHGLTGGDVADYAWAVSRVALTVWAYEELARGANLVRRLLGAGVLVAIVAGLVHELR